MEAKHTKGEWKARNNDNYCLVYSELHGGITLCNHEGKHKEEHEANAKLIAAAPDLLEALQDLVSDYEFAGDYRNMGALVSKAKAAIKKATE